MGKIYYIMGVTCSGKSTLLESLLKVQEVLHLDLLLEDTSRPMRESESEGVQYYFHTKKEFEDLIENGEMITYISFETNFKEKICYYGISKNSIKDLDTSNYITIGNIDGFKMLRDKLGEDIVIPIFLYTDDKIILSRIIDRVESERSEYEEIHNRTSKEKIDSIFRDLYKEQCRRYITDIDKYSIEAAEEAGIDENHRFNTEENVYFSVMDLMYKDIVKDKEE